MSPIGHNPCSLGCISQHCRSWFCEYLWERALLQPHKALHSHSWEKSPLGSDLREGSVWAVASHGLVPWMQHFGRKNICFSYFRSHPDHMSYSNPCTFLSLILPAPLAVQWIAGLLLPLLVPGNCCLPRLHRNRSAAAQPDLHHCCSTRWTALEERGHPIRRESNSIKSVPLTLSLFDNSCTAQRAGITQPSPAALVLIHMVPAACLYIHFPTQSLTHRAPNSLPLKATVTAFSDLKNIILKHTDSRTLHHAEHLEKNKYS